MRGIIASVAVAAAITVGAGNVMAVMTDTTTALTPAEVKTQLASAESLIIREDYSGAIRVLNDIVGSNPREADAYNLLGFSYRKSKDFDRAERNYKRALRLDPDHKGAIEYYGELFLETNRRDRAVEMLARLEQLCPNGCSELDTLRKAFAGEQTTRSGW